MLKIQLTWLQPSLGLIGIALLLSAPMAASAAPKTVATKIPKQNTVATSITGSVSPDVAIRQLALNTIAQSGAGSRSATANVPQSNLQPIASFLAPTGAPATIKPKLVQHSVASAVTSKAATTPIVPGLFIGRAEVSSPNLASAPVLSERLIAAPKPTAEMFASTSAANPFPVVMPGQMKPLKSNTSTPSIPTIQATPAASNPLASIPAGLQRILGNAPVSQPTAATTTPVAKTIAPKTDSLYALSRLVSDEATTPVTTASGGSLKLGTAQVYAVVPKFSLSATKATLLQPVKAKLSLVAAIPARQDFSVATAQPKSDFVALLTARLLAPASPSWSASNSRHSLGGLILGSHSQDAANSLALLTLPTPNRNSIY